MVDRLVAPGGETKTLVLRLPTARLEIGEPGIVALLLLLLRPTDGEAVHVHREGYPTLARPCRSDHAGSRARHVHAHGERTLALRDGEEPVDALAVERGEAHAEHVVLRRGEIRCRRFLHGDRHLALQLGQFATPIALEVLGIWRERHDLLLPENDAVHFLAHARHAQMDAQRPGGGPRQAHLHDRLLREIDAAPPHDVRPAVVHPGLDGSAVHGVAVLALHARAHGHCLAHLAAEPAAVVHLHEEPRMALCTRLPGSFNRRHRQCCRRNDHHCFFHGTDYSKNPSGFEQLKCEYFLTTREGRATASFDESKVVRGQCDVELPPLPFARDALRLVRGVRQRECPFAGRALVGRKADRPLLAGRETEHVAL